MNLPDSYVITPMCGNLVLTYRSQTVHACPNKGDAKEALEKVAEWDHRERRARVVAWKEPLGSEKQGKAHELMREAEKTKLRLMNEASGVRLWR